MIAAAAHGGKLILILLLDAIPEAETAVHPAEEAVRAHYEERISYLKPNRIHYALRDAVNELLPDALLAYPPPSDAVTDEELERWMIDRANDVYKGGNNYFGLPLDAGQTIQPMFRRHHSLPLTPESLTSGMTHAEYRSRSEDLAQRALAGALPEQVDDWKDWIVRDRLRVNVIEVQAHMQLEFGERIGELRTGRMRLRLAKAS